MDKSKRLKPIAELNHNREQQAAKLFAMAQADLQQHTLQLEQLQQYRQEYKLKLQNHGQQGISAFQLQEFQRFISQLDKLIVSNIISR